MKRKQQSQSQDRGRKIKRSYTEIKGEPAVEERETVYEYEAEVPPKLMGDVYLEHRLQDACDRKKIEKFYWKALLRSIVDLPEREQHNIVLDEIQLIKDHSSSYHLIVQSIEDRASFLNQLATQFDKHANKKKIRMTQLANICATIDNLRLATLYVIERISQWRSNLKSNIYRGTLKKGQELSARQSEYQFYFRGNNVTRLLQHDTDFIKQSILTRFIEFSAHIDPLFTQAHLTTDKDVQIPKCIAKFLKVQSQMVMRLHQADSSYKEMLEALKVNGRRNIISRITNDNREQGSRSFIKYVKTEAAKKPMLLGQTFIKESTTDHLKKRFRTEPKIQPQSLEVELSQKQISKKSIGINTKTMSRDLAEIIVPTTIQPPSNPSNPESMRSAKKAELFTSAPPSNVFEKNVNLFPRINRILPIQQTDRNMFVSRSNWVKQRAIIEKQLRESIFCEEERHLGKRSKKRVQKFTYIDAADKKPQVAPEKKQSVKEEQESVRVEMQDESEEDYYESQPIVENKVEPKVETKSPPKVETRPQSKIETKAQPKVEAKAQPKVEARAQPIAEPKVEPEIQPKVQEKVEPEPEPEPPKLETSQQEQLLFTIPKIEVVDIGIQKDRSEPPSVRKEVIQIKRGPAYLLPAKEQPPRQQPPEEPAKLSAKQSPAKTREEPPKELPKQEPPKQEPKPQPPKEEPKPEPEPKPQPPKEEPKPEPEPQPPKEQPKPEAQPQPPKQEPKPEPQPQPPKQEPKPEPKPQPPKQEPKPQPPQQPIRVPTPPKPQPQPTSPPKIRPKNHVLLPSGHYVVPRKVKLSKLQAYINFYYADKPNNQQETASLKKLLLPQSRLFTNMYFHEFQQDTKFIGFSVLYIVNNLKQRILYMLALKMFTQQPQATTVIKDYIEHLWKKDPANKICFIQHILDSSAMIPQILTQKLKFQIKPNELKFKELKNMCWIQSRTTPCQKTNIHHSTFLFEMSSIATDRLPNDAISAPQLEAFSQYNFYQDQKLITALTKYKIKSNNSTETNTVRSAISSTNQPQPFMNFKSLQQLNKYLQQQKVTTYKAQNIKSVALALHTIYDNFPVQYISNDNSIIFKTDNVVSFFGRTKQYDFLLINFTKNNAGFAVAFLKSKGMEADDEKLRDKVKKLLTIINGQFKYEEPTVVRLGELNKQLYGKIANIDKSWSIFGNVKIGINWIDYLEGGKVYDLPQKIEEFQDEMTVVIMTKADVYSAISAIGIIDNDFSEESEQAS